MQRQQKTAEAEVKEQEQHASPLTPLIEQVKGNVELKKTRKLAPAPKKGRWVRSCDGSRRWIED